MRESQMKRGAISAPATLDQPAHNQPSSRSLTQDKPRKATQLTTDQITNLEIDELNEELRFEWTNEKKKKSSKWKKNLIKKKKEVPDLILNYRLDTHRKKQQFSFSIYRLEKRNDLLASASISSQTVTLDAGGWHGRTKHRESFPLVYSCC